MVTIRGYADAAGISYEAARQQVNRYRDELEGHISKQGRTQYLDDDAVAFLTEHRKKNPVVVMQADQDAEKQQLREENKALLVKVAELQDALIQKQDALMQLQADNMRKDQAIALLEAKQAQEQEQEQEQPKKKGFWARLFGE